MSWSTRRSALVFGTLMALGSVALSQQGQIQISGKRAIMVQAAPMGGAIQPGGPGAAPTEPDAFSSAVDLPKDNERRKMIEAAGDYIRIEDWATAIRQLSTNRKSDSGLRSPLRHAENRDSQARKYRG